MADACECGNEPSGSVKCGEFLAYFKGVTTFKPFCRVHSPVNKRPYPKNGFIQPHDYFRWLLKICVCVRVRPIHRGAATQLHKALPMEYHI